MPFFTDQLGRTILVDRVPQRIISVVPSQTELLYTLGLDAAVVGITKFCVHPQQWFRQKTRVGGTKDIRPGLIQTLEPDLILANKEENDKDQIEYLSRQYPVWISDIKTLPDALHMIGAVGGLTGKEQEAQLLISEIENRFAGISSVSSVAGPRTAYFIWRKPWMVAGGDTFIQDMLGRCGFLNIFRDQLRYPSIELETLAASDCELVLLPSEPYPFREEHISEIREALPEAQIQLVDGEMFSWYGSRLLKAPAYFRRLAERRDLSEG